MSCLYHQYGRLNLEITLEWLESDFYCPIKKLIIEWTKIHQKELLKMWQDKNFRKVDPLI